MTRNKSGFVKPISSKFHSLRHTFLFAFVLSFMLPSFILILLLFLFYARATIQAQETQYRNTLKILSSHLVNLIDSNSGLSLSYLFDPGVSNLYYFLNKKDYAADEYAYISLAQSYTTTLNNRMTLLGDSITGVGFIPHQINADKLFYLRKYDSLRIREDFPYADSDWYRQLQHNNQAALFVPSVTSDVPNTISLIRTVKNIDKRQTIGYIILDISMDFIFESLSDITTSSYSGIFLMSPKGEFLFGTDEALRTPPHSWPEQDAASLGNDKRYDLYSFSDNNYGFTFYYFSSRHDLYASLRFASLIVLLFYVGMTVLAAIIFRRTSRKLSSSISPILSTMDKYHAGDSHIRCDTDRCRIEEIQSIAISLNEMIDKINYHIDNEYRFKMEQKIAEYQSLQSEINPHFLHNTLNLLIAQNRLGDRVTLEKSIISLSRLFRYTCEHNYNSTLSQEFDFIRDYLTLQQMRFEERLDFQIFLEPGLENFEIPKLLVQPLVENAIVHGLEPSEQNEFIRLSALTVTSRDGAAFTVITVINSGLPYIENKSYKRVGLKNIEDRLTIFSPNSFFIIRGGVDKPTKCTILIPQKSQEKPVSIDVPPRA